MVDRSANVKPLTTRLRRSLSRVAQARRIERALVGKVASLRELRDAGQQHYLPVEHPLVLISQVQRSGGTLLSQLFDGHPQCLAHPHELKIGHPVKWAWPKLDLDGEPEDWFRILFEDSSIDSLVNGYKKGTHNERPFPFYFLPSLQRDIFLAYLNSVERLTERAILNAYMTSYFNAWLDYQTRYAEKRVTTGFAAALAADLVNVRAFFTTYPDGRLISIIRNPHDWYVSARSFRAKRQWFGTLDSAVDWWKRSTAAAIEAKLEFGDRVRLVAFHELVGNTEGLMRSLSEFVGIDYHDSLLRPTFNTMPIRANSSFSVHETGILEGVLERRSTLGEDESAHIARHTGVLYEEALGMAVTG